MGNFFKFFFKANPFLLEVYCNRCRPSIQVNSVVENKNEAVHKAVVSSVLNNVTKKENIKGMRDLVLFKYESSIRVTLVLQNMVRIKNKYSGLV